MPCRVPGYHLLWLAFPDHSTRTSCAYGLLPVRSSLLRESRLISFPPDTEIFQFSGFASVPYEFKYGYPRGWVSPFGYRGIDARCQLPRAFRRLPRPSSPLTAKASTVRASSLDHITSKRLALRTRPSEVQHLDAPRASRRTNSRMRQVRSPNRLNDTSRLVRAQTLFYVPDFQRTRPAPQRPAAPILSCALPIQARLISPPRNTRRWWVWEDSNHRPHPYQGCALTT